MAPQQAAERTMARVRAKLIGGLLLGVAARHRVGAGPRLRRAAASRGPTVSGALSALLHSASIEPAAYSQDLAIYVAAKHSVGNLSGTRRAELQAVLATPRRWRPRAS